MIPVQPGEVGATALLVVRLWPEASGLRARVTWVTDVEHAVPLEFTSSSADELMQFVRLCLSEVLRQ